MHTGWHQPTLALADGWPDQIYPLELVSTGRGFGRVWHRISWWKVSAGHQSQVFSSRKSDFYCKREAKGAWLGNDIDCPGRTCFNSERSCPAVGDTAGLSSRTFLRCVRVRKLLRDGTENNASNTAEQQVKEICSAVAKLNPNKPRLRSSQAATPGLSVTTNTRVNYRSSAPHSCQRTPSAVTLWPVAVDIFITVCHHLCCVTLSLPDVCIPWRGQCWMS